jgi:hypothetical protein
MPEDYPWKKQQLEWLFLLEKTQNTVDGPYTRHDYTANRQGSWVTSN